MSTKTTFANKNDKTAVSWKAMQEEALQLFYGVFKHH
jgi:hypothetical protein